ncbi:MAG: S9 family peptidase [Bacteroidales bacterium]|nr:S9 family peptidase [Bacteroidales bacterium]
MKRFYITLLAVACLMAAGCNRSANGNDGLDEAPAVVVENGRFTPDVMWALGKKGDHAVSPDGEMIAYTVTRYDMAANKGNADIYIMSTEGGEAKRLTNTDASEYNLEWISERLLVFIRGGRIVQMDVSSGVVVDMSGDIEGLEGFRLSPDGDAVVFVKALPKQRAENLQHLYEGLDKTTGRINEDLMYRHWDGWVDDVPHIFYARIENGRIIDTTAKDLLEGEPYECPMRPMGGIEQFAFSPDGKQIAYTCRKKTGKDYALSTNSDIYLYNVDDGSTRNLSTDIMGYDINPVFNHDGTMIAWESMARDGYESDKSRLMVMDLATGERTDLTEHFDYGVYGIVWSDDDRELLATVLYRGMQEIFAFGREDKAIRQISHGYHDINFFTTCGTRIYAHQVSIQYPAEVYCYNTTDSLSNGEKLTKINDATLEQVRMGKVEEHWIKTHDGKDMLTWLIYPYDYDSTKVYPALLFCEGGPQSMVSQFWSTRWNFEVMSGAGYFVIAPNRRGCPGFGTAWCEEISGDYGGLCMQDYITATDYFAKSMPQIDNDRIGACGASFGGFSIYWLAGHNDSHRFKAFLAHNGMFNFEQQYLETEESWFTNWDLGGPYWDKSNAKAQRSYSFSPHRFVDNWNTPLCVVHSEMDYRIVASQGMAAYNAAKLRGLDARYLYFPDECHWVLRPQNSLLWHRNFIDWFDKYLK